MYGALHESTDTQCPCWIFQKIQKIKGPQLYFYMLHTAPVRALGEGLAYQVCTMWLISLINGWFCDWGLWITYRQSRVRSAEASGPNRRRSDCHESQSESVTHQYCHAGETQKMSFQQRDSAGLRLWGPTEATKHTTELVWLLSGLPRHFEGCCEAQLWGTSIRIRQH